MPSNVAAKREARILTLTWVALVSLTLGSFWVADSNAPSSGATAWLLAIAALKSHIIAGIFMEMRWAPLASAAAMSGFLLAEAALIVAILP